METYITICKVDGQGEFAVGSGNSNRGSVSTLEGWDGEEMRRSFKRKRIYVYLWLIMLRFDRKQQNSINRLSFKKISLKNSNALNKIAIRENRKINF